MRAFLRLVCASPSAAAIAVVMALFMVITVRWSWNQGPGIIRSDAAGYHGYLRALFITHDLGHQAFDPVYLHRTPQGGTLNKYTVGTAVLQAPFFLVAHALAPLTGHPRDGLSRPYQLAVSCAALVYALLGLMLMRRVLRGAGTGEATRTALVLVLGLATQLPQYVCLQPGWSHVHSFFLVCLFLHTTQRLAEAPGRARLMGWAAVFGLIVLVRPVNALVLLGVPVLLGGRTGALITVLRQDFRGSLLAAGAFSGVLSVQAALWYAQTGSLLADGYQGEGFYWWRPAVREVLIGIRRGLFVWAPALVPAVLAIGWMWRRDRPRAMWSLVYWAANTYVIASWWMWYYGSGWGQRVYIDHYPVILIPLALMLEGAGRGLRRATRTFLALAAGFTLAQFYQYNHRLLHVESMDLRKYKYAFLRFGDDHRDRLGGMDRVPPFHPNGMDTVLHTCWDAEGPHRHWSASTATMQGAHSGDHVLQLTAADSIGPMLTVPAGVLPPGRKLFLVVRFERWVGATDDTWGVHGVAEVAPSAGDSLFALSFPMEDLPPSPGRWERVVYRIPLPAAVRGGSLRFYFRNTSGAPGFMADDLCATVMAVRPFRDRWW